MKSWQAGEEARVEGDEGKGEAPWQSEARGHVEGKGCAGGCSEGLAVSRQRQDMVHAVFGTHRLASEARWPQLPGETCR